ncbi:MAG: type VI secretion system-associated protein TagF [Ignavibacteria bacterium]|nr:type VI secretion system-associated protein TagF [Ignavibacteria bacterium]
MFAKFDNTVGYFGKLPAFNDFVKFNSGGEELLVLDKWLQDGLLSAKMKLKSEWVNYYRNSEQFFFFYPFTGTKRALAGLLIPGLDKSGREFPFLIFFYLNKDQLNNIPSHLIPMILIDILNEFKIAVIDISSITDLSIINERLNKISYTINNLSFKNNVYQNYLSNTSQAAFWNRVMEGYDDSAKLLFLNSLYISSTAPKEKVEPIIISFISNNVHYVNDLSFFIHLTLTFQKTPYLLPAVFWTDSENKNHLLYLFSNKPLPNNFVDLICKQADQNNFINKTENDKNINSINSSFKNILNRNITLNEFLRAF